MDVDVEFNDVEGEWISDLSENDFCETGCGSRKQRFMMLCGVHVLQLDEDRDQARSTNTDFILQPWLDGLRRRYLPLGQEVVWRTWR